MRQTPNRWVTASAAVVCFCGMAWAQQANSKDPSKAVRKNAAAVGAPQKTTGPRITLLDATRVSTADALKAVAGSKQAAPDAASHLALEGIVSNKPAATADSAVVEFQPAAPGSASKPIVAPSSNSKGSILKNVHGDLYGSSAAGIAGNNAEGSAVGATSKAGKTSIYVQSDHAQGPLAH